MKKINKKIKLEFSYRTYYAGDDNDDGNDNDDDDGDVMWLNQWKWIIWFITAYAALYKHIY